MKKKLLSLMLALMLALALLPVSAFAADASKGEPLTVGNITLSDVVVTDKYEVFPKEMFDFPVGFYDFGMIGFWYEEEKQFGYSTFGAYLIPDDAEIVFDLTKERSVQVDFYTLREVSGPHLSGYEANFVAGLNPADSSVDKWGVNKEDIAAQKDGIPVYNLLICYSGNQDPVYVMFASDFPPTPAFTDVPAGAFYADAVNWAVGKDITNGTGGTSFSPGRDCTHAQILTFLYRAARGEGTAAAEDMDKAISWAREKGMIGADFNSSAKCTRADAVNYIWQAFDKESAPAGGFHDVDAGAPYAKAVDWAVANGITDGTGGGNFSPDKVCNRGTIATFLHRAYVPEVRLTSK